MSILIASAAWQVGYRLPTDQWHTSMMVKGKTITALNSAALLLLGAICVQGEQHAASCIHPRSRALMCAFLCQELPAGMQACHTYRPVKTPGLRPRLSGWPGCIQVAPAPQQYDCKSQTGRNSPTQKHCTMPSDCQEKETHGFCLLTKYTRSDCLL